MFFNRDKYIYHTLHVDESYALFRKRNLDCFHRKKKKDNRKIQFIYLFYLFFVSFSEKKGNRRIELSGQKPITNNTMHMDESYALFRKQKLYCFQKRIKAAERSHLDSFQVKERGNGIIELRRVDTSPLQTIEK